jgi:hypothetical protein
MGWRGPCLVSVRPSTVGCTAWYTDPAGPGPSTQVVGVGSPLGILSRATTSSGRRLVPDLAPEHAGDLVRAPGRVPFPQLEEADDDFFARRQRARIWPPALLDEARVAIRPEPAQPLVAGPAGDAVLQAERRNVRTRRSRLLDELQLLAHGSLFFPGHATGKPVSDVLVPHRGPNAGPGQTTPNSNYIQEQILKPVLRRGRILLYGTCTDARGIQDAEIAEGKRRSNFDEFTQFSVAVDELIVL